MSIRDQERRQREAERRIAERMRMADKHVRGSILSRQKAAERRAEEVKERIEKGDVDPRPLPSLREDSMASMESMPSMESSPSMESIEYAKTASGVTEKHDPAGYTKACLLKGSSLTIPRAPSRTSPKERPKRQVREATYTCTPNAGWSRWGTRCSRTESGSLRKPRLQATGLGHQDVPRTSIGGDVYFDCRTVCNPL